MVWSLANLGAETRTVAYLDDSSMHDQMVRFATHRISQGHLPLTSWFPYLGLGSPHFLHYQSLPAMLTGLLGLGVGPDPAFAWSLYLLLCLWPVSVYAGARLFGVEPWGAAASAAMAPFLMSAVGVGYEQTAYLWVGYGVWTQLWAALTLPLAWGLSWRAVRDGTGFLLAALAIAATVALHFETGYLALVSLILWPLLSPRALKVRARRAALLLAGALLAAAWVTVPLVAQRAWAATNEILHGSSLANGYGAGRVLGWLVSGQLLDAGRLPVVTLLAAAGLVLATRRWRSEETGRALVVVFVACLLLSFGRATFGLLVGALPGSGDIFFRRFMMGAQLGALLLAGMAAAWCGRHLYVAAQAAGRRWRPRSGLPVGRLGYASLGAALGVVALAPGWLQLGALDRHNAAAVGHQVAADRSQGAEVDELVATVKRAGDGRVYAGMPSNWGERFTVGAVPVFKYLESRDADEVGYTLRTASLMTDPEYFFDERNPSDYILFGVRYLILPLFRAPPVPARRDRCAGRYCLWSTLAGGFIHVGRLVGSFHADRTNVGVRSIRLLRSSLAEEGRYLIASFAPPPGGSRPGLRGASDSTAPVGRVLREGGRLEEGRQLAVVDMRRAGVAVLSASFDPGWKVSVDGRPAQAIAIAPALVGAPVPAGRHRVEFRYQGFGWYPWLLALSALGLGWMGLVDRGRSCRRRAEPRRA